MLLNALTFCNSAYDNKLIHSSEACEFTKI